MKCPPPQPWRIPARLYKYRPVDGSQEHFISYRARPYWTIVTSTHDPGRCIPYIHRRAMRAGILARIGNHSFRATGITEYLRNGGKLEVPVATELWAWIEVRTRPHLSALSRRFTSSPRLALILTPLHLLPFLTSSTLTGRTTAKTPSISHLTGLILCLQTTEGKFSFDTILSTLESLQRFQSVKVGEWWWQGLGFWDGGYGAWRSKWCFPGP